jgi:hypothetical protein
MLAYAEGTAQRILTMVYCSEGQNMLAKADASAVPIIIDTDVGEDIDDAFAAGLALDSLEVLVYAPPLGTIPPSPPAR